MSDITISHKNVKLQQSLANEGKEIIAKALDVDEKAKSENDFNKRKQAIPLYKEGLALLKQSIELHLPPRQLNTPAINRAHDLRSKVRTNLQYAEERLRYIETELRIHQASTNTNPLIQIHEEDENLKPSSFSNNTPSFGRTTGVPSSRNPQPRTNRASQIRANRGEHRGGNSGARFSSPSNLRDISPTKSTTNSFDVDRERKKILNKCTSIPGLDSKLVESIVGEVIIKNSAGVKFKDISGQDKAKAALREMVVLPALKPELFTGLRTPAKGLLMFGPPGNGKTLLAKALATESDCHLINISASSLTSKWVGEAEKLVKTLFSVARKIQPCIIFMDEIDSLLSSRKEGENDVTRRMKTEFLLQFEGMLTESEEKLVIVAATNRPQELDDAALRRFTKRIYVEMPDAKARIALLQALLKKTGSPLNANEIEKLSKMTEGYTCSDLTNLAKDAAMAPLREKTKEEIMNMNAESMRKLNFADFVKSCERVRKSLSPGSLAQYAKWNRDYGDISSS